jgi:glycosyltransferase involved in cell wall biosynthesis
LKIISIGPAAPYRGGIAKFNESFVRTCKSSGNDTEIVSFKFLYPSFLFPGKTQYSDDAIQKELKIHSVIHSINPFNWKRVAFFIASLQPDLVVVHYWMPFFAPALGVIARKVSKISGVKIIAITHNLIPHEKQPGIKLLTRFFLKSLDGIVALSSSVIRDFESFKVPGKAICLPHPIYDIYGDQLPKKESLKYLNLDPSKKYLLFFGLIRKYKGLELLLQSFALLNDQNLCLIVAGEFYEDKYRYMNLVKELGIAERIIFTDRYIPDNEVKYYFSAVEMVVQPYLSATQSGVTQIAYQFNCPMIVTNVGGLAEIVINGKTGFVCDRDPVEISASINKALDPSVYQVLLEGIKQEKARFSWKSFVEKVLEMGQPQTPHEK